MPTIKALLDKLCAKPTPADFRYSDFCRVMAHFGYLESNKGATSGSRVKFYHVDSGSYFLLHKPHGGNSLSKKAVDGAVKFLRENGHI